MYAYIYYIEDGYKRVVHIRDIKDFNPKHLDDFDASAPVRALWRGLRDEIPAESADRYKAIVLKLGETRESLEDSIRSKRIKIPKINHVADKAETTQSSDEEATQFESLDVQPGRSRNTQQGVPKGEAARLQALIRQRQKRIAEDSDSDDLETSGGDCTVPDKIHQEVVQERNTYKRKCKALEEEVRALTSKATAYRDERDKLRELNLCLQTEVMKIVRTFKSNGPVGQGPPIPPPQLQQRHVAHSEPSVAPPPQSEELFQTEDYPPSRQQPRQRAVENDAAHDESSGGDTSAPSHPEGVDIRPDVLRHIQSQRSDSLFIKCLGVAVWGTEGLADRSVTGRPSNRYDREPKSALSPEKLHFVQEMYRKHLKARGEMVVEEAVKKKVRKCLSEKISDINRKK